MESNIDLNASYTTYLSKPQFSTIGNQGRNNWWATCNILIAIIEDEAVQEKPNGVIQVGEDIIWSREISKSKQKMATKPDDITIQQGTNYWDKPIFGIQKLDFTPDYYLFSYHGLPEKQLDSKTLKNNCKDICSRQSQWHLSPIVVDMLHQV